MDNLLLVVLVGVWLTFGYLGARLCAIAFEQEFGEGATPTFLAVVDMLLGPAGLVASLFSVEKGRRKQAWGVAWGNEMELDYPYHVDERRNFLDSFFLAGVKNLPNYDVNTEHLAARYYSIAPEIRAERA